MEYSPAQHYDRVTAAWTLLLGEELHYGLFDHATEELARATKRLTDAMILAAAIGEGMEVLDVGCGTGAPACHLAKTRSARVTGITTSAVGLERARARAIAEHVEDLVSFEFRDGMDNRFPGQSFDRVWALESSHLMRSRDQFIAECARVLRPAGKLVLCDIVLHRRLSFGEVRRLREPLALLREVFGDARMEPVEEYERLAQSCGLAPRNVSDLSEAIRPTFECWRQNAQAHRATVVELLGEADWRRFVAACDVLERFWDEGLLGYALLAWDKQ